MKFDLVWHNDKHIIITSIQMQHNSKQANGILPYWKFWLSLGKFHFNHFKIRKQTKKHVRLSADLLQVAILNWSEVIFNVKKVLWDYKIW